MHGIQALTTIPDPRRRDGAAADDDPEGEDGAAWFQGGQNICAIHISSSIRTS